MKKRVRHETHQEHSTHVWVINGGCTLDLKGFFSNFSAIMLLAIVGTLIATFITGGALIWMGNAGLITKLTGAEAYLYGSLISAVDPVATLSVFKKNGAPSLLFNLVFGESMLNDGVGACTSHFATLLDVETLISNLMCLLIPRACLFSHRRVHSVPASHPGRHERRHVP
jgi:NhaP-type Na+/H+ or K+/H+ antiporter